MAEVVQFPMSALNLLPDASVTHGMVSFSPRTLALVQVLDESLRKDIRERFNWQRPRGVVVATILPVRSSGWRQ